MAPFLPDQPSGCIDQPNQAVRVNVVAGGGTNAAQESGGNLATLVTQTQNNAQIADALNQILAQLKILNMNFSANTNNSSIDDLDAVTASLLQ
jgi:hypothetical protein